MTAKDKASPKKSRLSLPLTLSIVALLIAVLIAIAMLFTWQHQQEATSSDSKKIQAIVSSQQQLHSSQGNYDQSLNALKENLGTLKDKMTRMAKRQGDITKLWELEESQHLIKLAVYNVTLNHDVPQATKLLQEADNSLKKLGDADLIAVRKTLADNIAKLKATPVVDTPGLVLKLQSLQQQVAKLPLTASPLPKTTSEHEANAPKNESWQDRVKQSFEGLKNLVVIRRLQEPVKPLMSPDQMVYLVENIQLQLSLASWAVIHKEPAVFTASLNQASDWVQNYFVASKPITQSVMSTLKNLKSENISPQAPNINSSLDAIDKAMKQIANKEHTS